MSIFQSLSSLTPVQKIISSAVSAGTDIANSMASKVTQLGQSSIASISSGKSDSLLSGAASEFFLGTATDRISAAALTISRFASTLDPAIHQSTVTPEGKISSVNDGNSGMTYPPDLGEYYISFNFMNYERPNPFIAAKEVNTSLVYLPIPQSLVETHQVEWAGGPQGMIGDIVNSAQKTISGDSGGSGDFTKQSEGMGYRSALNVLGAVPVVGEAGAGALTQLTGAIPNPFLSVIFSGPTLRSMSFDWSFHPHTPDESTLIKNIINEFRKKMLPNLALAGSANVLGYPSMVEVKLYPNDDMLYKMKKCVVTGINSNYAPNGVPSFFKGTKAPTFITFSVQLQEIEYFVSEDFGGTSGSATDTALSSIVSSATSSFNVLGGTPSDANTGNS